MADNTPREDEDTLGHRRYTEDEDTQGHTRRLSAADDEDDTEGHTRRLSAADDDDVEGHLKKL